MPELTGEVTGASLAISGGAAAFVIVAFCAVVTIAARHFAPITVWLGSGLAVGALVLLAFAQLYLQPLAVQDVRWGSAAFFLIALIGIPSAAAVAVAVYRATRPERRKSVLFDSALVIGCFLAAVPVAAVVASLI
jgi:hypothetical protein